MKAALKGITQRQVEAMLAPWRDAKLHAMPPKGWIRAIREGLGMPASYLARKMDVEQSTVKRYEDAEASGAISLKTLQRIADALGCELKYALVPKKTLPETIQDQATVVAQQQMKTIAHTMALESQSTSKAETEALVQEQAQDLINGSWRDLWR
ncbi:MAG: mobile mystery protein A [Spirochaetota bacterium]